MFRLIVFDLDGTLVDSQRDLADSANATLAEHGCGPLSQEAIGHMVGAGAATLVTRVFAAAGCPQPPDALARFLAIYEGRLLRFTCAYPGIDATLLELGARARLAVLTNKPLGAARTILAALDLARHFPSENVVGGDGPFARKPDPSGLRHLMHTTATTPSETILIGDSLIDWQTARAAETAICLVRYGFGFRGFPTEQLGAQDRLVDVANELLTVL